LVTRETPVITAIIISLLLRMYRANLTSSISTGQREEGAKVTHRAGKLAKVELKVLYAHLKFWS